MIHYILQILKWFYRFYLVESLQGRLYSSFGNERKRGPEKLTEIPKFSDIRVRNQAFQTLVQRPTQSAAGITK